MATNKWGLAVLDEHPALWGRCGVYCILNTINGKYYIGSSSNIGKRKGQHWDRLRKGSGSPHLQAAWNLYGEAAFQIHALSFCAPEQRLEIEQRFIDDLDATNPDLGYNVARHAATRGCISVSAETRARISRSTMGHAVSDETKKKMSESKRGRKRRPFTAETRKRMSAAQTGLKKPPRGPEYRQKRSDLAKALWAKRKELGLKGFAPLPATTGDIIREY